MAGDVIATTLGQVTSWTSGGTPSKSNPDFWNGTIPWISASTMKSDRVKDSVLKISKEGLENGSRIAKKESCLLLVRGSELHKRVPICFATADVAFNQDVKALVASSSLIPEYLFYWLKSKEDVLLGMVEPTGIGAGKLDTSRLQNMLMEVPPLDEQRHIVKILGDLDDKIELDRKMNETLESMARALFKSWFVDFDPVRAKVEGRQPAGMDADTAALFPSEFEESELGLVPKGWMVMNIGRILKERTDKIGIVMAPEYSSTNGGLQLRSDRFKKSLSRTSGGNKRIDRGNFVFGLSREVLNYGLMRDEVGSVSSAYRVFRVDEELLSSVYIDNIISSNPAYFYNAVSSSSREGQSISTQGLLSKLIVVPPRSTIESYDRIRNLMAGKCQNLSFENSVLAKLRETLINRFYNG